MSYAAGFAGSSTVTVAEAENPEGVVSKRTAAPGLPGVKVTVTLVAEFTFTAELTSSLGTVAPTGVQLAVMPARNPFPVTFTGIGPEPTLIFLTPPTTGSASLTPVI